VGGAGASYQYKILLFLPPLLPLLMLVEVVVRNYGGGRGQFRAALCRDCHLLRLSRTRHYRGAIYAVRRTVQYSSVHTAHHEKYRNKA